MNLEYYILQAVWSDTMHAKLCTRFWHISSLTHHTSGHQV